MSAAPVVSLEREDDATPGPVERALLGMPRRVSGFDISTLALPPVLRPRARRSVLDITEFFGETSGGVRTYLLEKAKYIEARAELRHVVVVPGERDAITETRGVRCYRLRGPRVPTRAPYRFMLATRSGRRIVEHERPDVIEVGSVGLVPWIVRHAADRLGIPLVAFYHSHFPRLIAPVSGAGAHRRAAAALAWRYLRGLDSLFATTIVASDYAARELRAAGLERTDRVPLGVDLDLFHPRRRQSAALTRQLVGLSTRPLVMYVGRVAAEKRLDVLIDAWRIAEGGMDAELAIVGSGPEEVTLKARARGLRVRWIPYVANRARLANVIAAADLYVAPSPVETFGLSAVEALASGVPVLSVDQGGVAELVERSGAGGCYASESPGALAEQLQMLLRADLRTLGVRGQAYAAREHHWETVFERLFAVYERCVAR